MPSLVRRAIVLAAVTPLIVLLVGAAQASAAPPETQTFAFSFPVTNPCNGEGGTLSGTMTTTTLVKITPEQFLFQQLTQTDEAFTPDNPASLSATGHGVSHFTFIDNHDGGPAFSGTTVVANTSTDVFFASGAHVVIHDTAHTIFREDVPVVDFDRPVLVCKGV
jgi:hypothetical protein